MLVEINQKEVSVLRAKLSKYDNLVATINLTAKNKKQINKSDYLFILKGADNEGIVHSFTNIFSKLNINILDLETKTINAPITGQPLFYIKAKVSIPISINIEILKAKLNNLSNETNVAIKLVEFDEELNH